MLSFHREGYKIIIFTFLIVLSGILLSERLIELYWFQKVIQTILLFFLIIVLQFFRNPKRVTEINDTQIIAPVDGKVVVVEEVEEPEYFKGKRLQVSIFMSPINVHVTRYALNGTVKYSKYHPGKYLVAWHPKASTENERTTIGPNRIFIILGQREWHIIAYYVSPRVLDDVLLPFLLGCLFFKGY